MIEGQFDLYSNTEIRLNGVEEPPIVNAAAILKRDMEKILEPSVSPGGKIVIEPSGPEIPDESWILIVTKEKMLIQYRGGLGCVYALLFISAHFLGITPFWFWNDGKCARRGVAAVPAGVWRSPEYTVRFRGWFVNDEVLIDNWRAEDSEEHWRMVFEALLRCGGNITIPGTDGNSKKYRMLAASMGLWVTHHHAEPLGAEIFLRAYPGEMPSYNVNGNLFEKLWEQAVIEQKDENIIWNLGFRGQGDRPFWEDDPECVSVEQRGRLINNVMAKQLEIIRRYVPNPVCCVNIYGEIAALYRDGFLNIPPGIIKIWSDNGYGRMVSRRQGNSNPRIPSLPPTDSGGPHGIYYHCSFHDLQASNHLTMSPNSMEFLAAELESALNAGAGECWIVNCGSVKPHLYALDMVCAMWRDGKIDVRERGKSYVQTYYGGGAGDSVAAMFDEYAACTARYGVHKDDRAGEQIWHYPIRELLYHWLSGDAKDRVESLIWLTGEIPFAAQVETLEKIAAEALSKWEAFCAKCEALLPLLPEDSRRLFRDSLLLHGLLHLHGAAGTKAFCGSFLACAGGDTAAAFLLADKSYSHYAAGAASLTDAEHDKWAGYYDGDCLTDVRLTASCLSALVSYIRVTGDGPSFHKWEKDFLVPAAERNIMLLSSKRRALTSTELAGQMMPQLLLSKKRGI